MLYEANIIGIPEVVRNADRFFVDSLYPLLYFSIFFSNALILSVCGMNGEFLCWADLRLLNY
jgi:hypothetical protein